jgi:hypothetical protein
MEKKLLTLGGVHAWLIEVDCPMDGPNFQHIIRNQVKEELTMYVQTM